MHQPSDNKILILQMIYEPTNNNILKLQTP